MIRLVQAQRYVLPFREGSSVPALVEGDDLGFYVVKLRGAGQGPKALVAELICGELARVIGLHVPEIVLVDMPKPLAESEPDPELCLPLEASAGLNLGLDYLPGSITFDPAAGPAPEAELASRIVVCDAFITNVDRTPRNPNLLVWHDELWVIDHGASLYFHHGWSARDGLSGSEDPFVEVRDHVLLRWAAELDDAGRHLTREITGEIIEHVVGQVPATWLVDRNDDGDGDHGAARERAGYVAWLRARLEAVPLFVKEAQRARAELF